MTAAAPHRNLNILVDPDWKEIGRMREECDLFFRGLSFREELRDALCMVVSELLENAIKYGKFKTGEKIELNVEVAQDRAILEVKSPLDFEGEEENMRRLDRFIQWIRGHQSPFQAYLERMRQVAAQPLDSDESGLGLVRIAYEGEAILDFYVSDSDYLCISAIFSLSRE